jgi:hypothetical protein
MLYKFDILFKKVLKSGGVKVVTYSQLLENSDAFGLGEGFADAEGELSMVLEGPETGFSINALMRKYRSQLVGHMNAEMFGRDFPLRFVFAKPNDLSSIRTELRDEDGYTYSSDVHTLTVIGSKMIDLSDFNSFVVLIAKVGLFEVTDDTGMTVRLLSGQAVLCSESIRCVTINSDLSTLIAVRSAI